MNAKLPPPCVAAVHDLSCFGRCALTVCMPTLSVLGIQTVPLPTALLSTHTGGFDNLFFTDLSEQMTEISAHFKRLEVRFDAVYSGFLGSARQICIVEDFIAECRERGRMSDFPVLIFIDPVMGDDGKLYSTYNAELVNGMRRLCGQAEVLTPNLTEACLLADIPYESFGTGEISEKEADERAYALCKKINENYGTGRIALTGVHFRASDKTDMVGTYCFCAEETFASAMCENKRLMRHYPGTGDIFASVLLGMMLKGADFYKAASLASGFTRDVISYSMRFDTPVRDGVLLEPCLKKLAEKPYSGR